MCDVDSDVVVVDIVFVVAFFVVVDIVFVVASFVVALSVVAFFVVAFSVVAFFVAAFVAVVADMWHAKGSWSDHIGSMTMMMCYWWFSQCRL